MVVPEPASACSKAGSFPSSIARTRVSGLAMVVSFPHEKNERVPRMKKSTGLDYRSRIAAMSRAPFRRHVSVPPKGPLSCATREVRDQRRCCGVEADHVEHAAVVRIRDREPVRRHADHDELRPDAHPLAVEA